MPFIKNDPRINREGRPPGSLNKKWHDIQWWYNLILDNYQSLTKKEKVELGLRGLNLIVSKLPNIPATPQESVNRIIDAQGELEKAEANEDTQSRSNTISLGNSPPQVQIGAPPERSL